MKISGDQLTARMKELGISTKRMTELTSIGENTIYRYRKFGVPHKRVYLFNLILEEQERLKRSSNEQLLEDFEKLVERIIVKKYGHKIDAIYDHIELSRIENLKKANKRIIRKKKSSKIA